MTSNYIGINGLVTQSLQEIKDDLTNKFRNIYGQNINLEQNSPDGQWLNILAQEKKDVLDLFTQYYNNLDVDRVIGIPQQILYKLNGLIIEAYTYSYCYVNVTSTKALTLDGLDENIDSADGVGYTVRDTNGNRWILAETIIFTGAETKTLNFRAAELGNVTALANTITIMETIIAGISGVNNPANNYLTGGVGETSSQYRVRRNKSMSVPSQGFEDSIESQMLNLDEVTQCKVYSNRTGSTSQGIPAHTVWVIVEGGNSDDIGKVIYNNIPPGIPMKGTQSVTITRVNGATDTVKYDVPTAVDLHIMCNIKNFGTSTLDVAYIKSQLALLDFSIGQKAEIANISTAIKDIIGDAGSPYDVEVSTDGITYTDIVTPSGLDEYFTVSTENIDITVVS